MAFPEPRPTLAIVVLDGVLALDLAVAVQAFGPKPTAFLALRDELESPYDVFLCGEPDTELRTAGMAMRDIQPWHRLAEADTIVVPGLDEPDRRRASHAYDAVAEAGRRGARLVGLCTGVFVLAFAGVLAGRRVTTHWALADRFRALFPEVDLDDDELFIEDGQVLTSGGMLAAADLCLQVLRHDHGAPYANDVARLLVSPPFRVGGQTQYRVRTTTGRDGTLADVMAWVDERLHEPLTLPLLADRAGTSPRTLARRFQSETGMSAGEWIAERRIARARALLEHSDMSVTDIAFATGFESLTTFRRRFAQATATTPREYRQTFAPSANGRNGTAP
jgi:AraC family transcriptional regulator, transcriptional activator FtrA